MQSHSRPEPGVVVETRWGEYATCPACRAFVSVDRWKRFLIPHDRPGVDIPCKNRWSAADLAAAISRDESLNIDEVAARRATYAYLVSCKGPKVDGNCTHGGCHGWVEDGLQWTLMGWRQAPADGQLMLTDLDS